MKKFFILMIAMLMSVTLSSFAGTKTSTMCNSKTEKVNVPTNIIVKQTITFDNSQRVPEVGDSPLRKIFHG